MPLLFAHTRMYIIIVFAYTIISTNSHSYNHDYFFLWTTNVQLEVNLVL